MWNKTLHPRIVGALKTQGELAEMRCAFINDAQQSAAEVDAGGLLYAMEDVHAYILTRAVGKTAKRPKPIKSNTRNKENMNVAVLAGQLKA